jgi:DNA-binding PadR family transcriptional regulator
MINPSNGGLWYEGTSEWEQSTGQHKRKVYAITPVDRQRMTSGQAEWRQIVDRLFKTMGGPAWLPVGDEH